MTPTEVEIIKARVQLTDLRMTMDRIELVVPGWPHHREPATAASSCRYIFDQIDYCLRMLEAFVGEPGADR